MKSGFPNAENKVAFRNYSWMETEWDSEGVSSDGPPGAGGRIEKRLGQSVVELPCIDLTAVSCCVSSPGGL